MNKPEVVVPDTAPQAPEPTPAPPAEGAAPAAPQRFFTKKEEPKAAPDEGIPDIETLPPELQKLAKGFQASYTKKFQSLADERRTFEEASRTKLAALEQSQATLLELLKGRVAPAADTPSDTPDLRAQIQTLRDEGRHDEADALLMEGMRQAQEAELAPIKREAQLSLMRSTFSETANTVADADPLVKAYQGRVAEVWDKDPALAEIRAAVVQSPDTIKKFLPFALRAIAAVEHSKALEMDYDARVEAGVKTALEAEKKKIVGMPARRLVETSPQSRESGPGRTGAKNPKAAVEAALAQFR